MRSDEESYLDENGKRRKRKKPGYGDDLDEQDADDINMRLDEKDRLKDLFEGNDKPEEAIF